MDFTTLFNGPAQAGSSALAGAAVAAAAAGGAAAPAGAGADGDFASLVALALGQLGAPAAADGQAEPMAGRARPHRDVAANVDAEPVTGETPSDAPDAATLAVLVALATPQPVAMPVVVDAPIPPAASATPVVAAPVEGQPAVADPGATTSAPSAAWAAPTTDQGAAFADALDAAAQPQTTADRASATVSDVVPTAQAPMPSDGPPLSATADGAAAVMPPAVVPQASAGEPVPAPAPPTTTPAPTAAAAATTVPTPAPASAPTTVPEVRPEAGTPAAPAQRPAGAPGREVRTAAQQIRHILAAAREGATPVTPTAPVTGAAPGAVNQAPAAVGIQAQVTGAPAHEITPAVGRTVHVAAAAATVAGAAPSESRADAEASGERGAEHGAEAPVGSVMRTAPVLDLRFDPVAAASTSPGTATVAPAAAMPIASPAAAVEALRAFDLPASARLDQALATLDPETRNLQAIVRTVRLFTAGDGMSEARLQLEPDHLGPVALTVRVEQGSVSAHFRADTPAAQRWIETHQQELRNGLREQGLEVKDVVVTTDPDGRRDRQQEGQPARPSRQRRSAAAGADAPRFEVLA